MNSFTGPSVKAEVDAIGVMIISGWTVLIPRKTAIEYVNSYNTNASGDSGFLEHDGRVNLSHAAAKISLSQEEAEGIIRLIKSVYAL